ncbi:hypothetical protein [Litorimonas haliclonae]|uniref:hypothetical protein n=1 Tax=Litorimonas haliclonae TaxID=2081977 RepID=UPI0039EE2688
MKIMHAATLVVTDLKRSCELYTEWLEYSVIEKGEIPSDLAESWGTPKTAGRPFAVLQPASGAEVFLRFIEQPAVPEYKALSTYGWNAVEICTQDTPKVAERMEKSPFEIIGPPAEIAGLPTIFPMQVKGPDEEIVYLTQIRGDLPNYNLPRAGSFIDKLFILVMGCSDFRNSKDWLVNHLDLSAGRDMSIDYTMINKAFGLPEGTQHEIATLIHEKDVFLEVDQYPEQATQRPRHKGMLPPCAAIGTFLHPDFDRIDDLNKNNWITPPIKRSGPFYNNKRSGTLAAPDGTLIEIVEA